jgi:hypothetical protein
MERRWVGESSMRRPMWSAWTTARPSAAEEEEEETGKGRRGMSRRIEAVGSLSVF